VSHVREAVDLLQLTPSQVIAHRLRAHHLDARRPPEALAAVVGACGVRNTPPRAFEATVFNRIAGIDAEAPYRRLYGDRSLLQAWSIRGVPLVFPTADRQVFTAALVPRPGDVWIYTMGIALALELLGSELDPLLAAARDSIGAVLAGRVVRSKRQLDTELAAAMAPRLSAEKQALWRLPSPYGPNQTLGEAVASFLLRPLSFHGLVCFGERDGTSPTFVRPADWLGEGEPSAGAPGEPAAAEAHEARRRLVHKFLHCFGPATVQGFAAWLGSSPDLRDRETICPDKGLQRRVWRLQVNPGAVLVAGRVGGTWKQATRGDRLTLTCDLFRPLTSDQREEPGMEAEAWAAFRGKRLAAFQING